MTFDQALVSPDRPFKIAAFFRVLSDLIQLRCIAAHLFFARSHVLRFFARFKDDGSDAQFG